MEKIFKKVEWNDGGPNDKGILLGFEKGFSEKQLKEKYNINHGFISFIEISKETYNNLKKETYNNYKMFKKI